MMKKELTIELLKRWISTAKNSDKTRALGGNLSVVDFYRCLYPNREPRCKREFSRGCIHGYKKHFYRWAKDVWRPWLHKNQTELLTFLTDFAGGGFGVVLYFKPKEEEKPTEADKELYRKESGKPHVRVAKEKRISVKGT